MVGCAVFLYLHLQIIKNARHKRNAFYDFFTYVFAICRNKL